MSDVVDFGVSLYGFTENWINNPEYQLEDMFRELQQLGIKKFEIVGSQVFSDYPLPKQEEIDQILSLCKQYDVEPFSYGGYIDVGRYSDHDMTDQEILNEVTYELLTAHRLGCPMMRGGAVPNHLLKPVAQMAEFYNVRIGFEVHAPSKPGDANIQETLAAIKETGSSHLGFVPDFGCFITKPNPLMVERYLSLGADKALIDFIVANRHTGFNEDTMSEKIKSMGGGDAELYAISELFGFLSFAESADLEGFKSLLPYSLYFHAKFYHIGEDCVETTIPYKELLTMIAESDFSGTIMTEYEGHCFYLNDASEQIERHLKMEKEILSSLAA
ncbi:TIM barrel protein [Aestuariicella hydrocarbonica]|uniref:TIM barrel protein n=1 Tax=Pseudomaricurvus hydrocarbonicus TaxID=1470433 RepID=A0A9E5MND1_9GAMM|nr:TIM barrel protein [Aestuariicella hydrocarbonica]NHO67394.1 TIM barrel protein [Aestuariicella hydrocarbonica]